jgi:hypothetical protein
VATEYQVRGMLLEEILLHLLRRSGYRPVTEKNGDPTLDTSPAGLCVLGRGAAHQIDAIADCLLQHPFSNPQRLLVEAKCYDEGKNVGIEVVRNALGTLRDVSENWTREPAVGTDPPSRSRYHYQYAIFSGTGYTEDAQNFAYAQDIYLFKFARSKFFKPIIDAIRRAAAELMHVGEKLHILRQRVRETLRMQQRQMQDGEPAARELFDNCYRLNTAYITMLDGRFAVFLVPDRAASIDSLQSPVSVRIRFDDGGFYILDHRERELFSFDVPEALFNHYAESGVLTPDGAVNMKMQAMSSFQAIRCDRDDVTLLQFRLDPGWVGEISRGISSPPPGADTITPRERFRQPLLQALNELGGRGETHAVIDRVGELMESELSSADREALKSGKIRWRNSVQFVRETLVKQGLLKNDSPRGLWEITEEGRRRLDEDDLP